GSRISTLAALRTLHLKATAFPLRVSEGEASKDSITGGPIGATEIVTSRETTLRSAPFASSRYVVSRSGATWRRPSVGRFSEPSLIPFSRRITDTAFAVDHCRVADSPSTISERSPTNSRILTSEPSWVSLSPPQPATTKIEENAREMTKIRHSRAITYSNLRRDSPGSSPRRVRAGRLLNPAN